jgi:putative MATE family efflux protein
MFVKYINKKKKERIDSMSVRERNLTEGNIKNQLLNLTWPMLFGMLGVVIFNLVDTYFVGKLGVPQLAALGFCFPVIMFVNGLSLGIGIGTSSLIARNIVTRDRGIVKIMASSALFLGILVVLFFVSVGMFTINPLFKVLGAEKEVIPYIHDYMSVWYMGVPFVIVPMIGNNVVRATGDTFTPGMQMAASAIINAILDPLLIFGYGPFPELGIKGAALSTVISRSIGLVVVLFILIRRERLLTVKLGTVKEVLAVWESVFHIAAPATLGMLITPLSIGFITKIIARFGKEAVAAFGVASRVEMFALMVMASLGSVLIIFIGQNISKMKIGRILEAMKYSAGFSLFWGVLVYVMLLFFGNNIASVFTGSAHVAEIAHKYFMIVGASYGFQGLLMLSTSAFNGINKPYPSALFSILRMIGLYLPLAALGAKLFELTGVFWSGFIANIIAGSMAFSYFYLRMRRAYS